jgi:hypothetical protein
LSLTSLKENIALFSIQEPQAMINRIQPDKWRHLFAGIVMGTVLQFVCWWLWSGDWGVMSVVSFTIIVAVSYGFELFSKITGRGHYDFIDAVASMIGGVIGMGITTIVVINL